MTKSNIGYATYKKGKLYFDEVGWEIIKGVARRQHRTPQQTVVQALKRALKQGYFNGKKG